jgi:hypothetical protein
MLLPQAEDWDDNVDETDQSQGNPGSDFVFKLAEVVVDSEAKLLPLVRVILATLFAKVPEVSTDESWTYEWEDEQKRECEDNVEYLLPECFFPVVKCKGADKETCAERHAKSVDE